MIEDNQKETNKSEKDQSKDEKSKLEIKKEKSLEDKFAESEDKLLRSLAEIENQRRRFEKEIKDAFEFGSFNFAKESLAILDNLQRAKLAIKNDEVVEFGVQKNLKIIDLTGAGDLFAAGFLHGHINNLSLKESLQKGTQMSSKIIQKIGARLS